MWDTTSFPGVFVAMCGFDGSGKTTQINRLANYYASQKKVIKTRQPSDWYRDLPEVRAYLDDGHEVDPQLLALWSAADRRKHKLDFLTKTLSDSNSLVLTDRYIFSSLSYFYARGLSFDYITAINNNIFKPTVSFYLQVPSDVILQRLEDRDGVRLKFEEKAGFIKKVCHMFFELTRIDKDFIAIDGTLPAAEITEMLTYHIQQKAKTDE